MRRSGRRPDSIRRRTIAGVGLLLVAAWIAAGLRHLEDDGRAAVLDSPLGILTPRMAEPGWHLVPPGLARLTRYPLQSTTLEIRADSRASALVTREGSLVDAGLVLRYHVDPARVLDVHRVLGPHYEQDALARWAREALAGAVGAARYADVSGARVEGLRDEVGEALGERLRQAGFVLLACEVTGFRLRTQESAGEGGAARAGTSAPDGDSGRVGRILLVGLDGADWNILDPLLAKGRLPHLDRLIRGGVRGRMRTLEPVLSPVLWTSIATGVVPGRHGILDFVTTTEREGERVPVTSSQRKVKAFWNILGERGIRVGVVGWWATWPAEPIDGFIVSDRVATQIPGSRPLEEGERRGKVHPAEDDATVMAATVAPESILPADLAPFLRVPADEEGLPQGQARLVDEFRVILASGRTYVAAALALQARQRTDVTAVYLEGTDTVGHLFMPFAPPPLAGVDPEGRQRFGHTVDAYYESVDGMVGRLLDGIRPETTIVVSDHGFRTGENRPLTESRIGYGAAADWHRKYGIIVLTGPAFRKGATIEEASILDVTPTLLRLCGLPVGEDMDGRPIEEAFEPAWSRTHPERYIPTWEGTGERAPADLTASAGSGAGTEAGPALANPPGADAATGVGDGTAPGQASATGGALQQAATGSPDTEGDAERLRRLKELGYLSGGGETSNTHNNRGTTLLAAGKYDEAILEFEKAIPAGEDNGIARLNIARARYRKKDYDGAIATLAEYSRTRPRSKEAETLLGNIAMERGQDDTAAEHFQKALQYEPNFTDARNGLGLLYERQGRHEEALAAFRRVIAIDPDYAEAHNNIGIILKGRGQIDGAIEAYRKAIAADPAFAGSYSNLAVIMEDRGDYKEAERLFREALRRTPGDAPVRANLGGLLYLAGRLEDAKRELEQAIKADPRLASAHNNLAAVLDRMGRSEEAIAAYRRAIEIDPGSSDLRHNLGLALMKTGRSDEGVREMQRALANDPNHRPTLLSLGRYLVGAGKAGEALAILKGGASRWGDDAELLLLLGEAASDAGDRAEAIRALEAAERLRPDDAQIRQRLETLRASGDDARSGVERP